MDTFIKIILFWIFLSLIFKYGEKLLSNSNKKNIFATKKKKGYVSANLDGLKGMMFISLIMAFIVASIFFTLALSGITDKEGNSLYAHTLLALSLFFIVLSIFIYTCRCKIYYNNEEIIKYRFLRKKQVFNYTDIKRIVVREKWGVTLYSNTSKLSFESDYSNYKNFIRLLEKKGLI